MTVTQYTSTRSAREGDARPGGTCYSRAPWRHCPSRHHPERSGTHRGLSRRRSHWADEMPRRRLRQHRRHGGSGRAAGARVIVHDWPGYAAQKNFAAGAGGARLDPVDRCRRTGHPRAGRARSRTCCAATRRPPATGCRASRGTSAAGFRSTDWYPDYQLRLYDRAARPLEAAPGARVGGGRRHARAAHEGAAALRLPRHRASSRDDEPLHDAGGRRCSRPAGARGWPICVVHPLAAFLRNYVLRRGFADGVPGLVVSAMNAALRLPEVRQALGARRAPARPAVPGRRCRTRCAPSTSTRRGPGAADRTRSCSRSTAWPKPVTRPCCSRTRAANCAGARGDGLRFLGFSPRSEFDVQAGWQLAGVLRDVSPTWCTRTTPWPCRWSPWRCRCAARPRRGRSSSRHAGSIST